MILCSRVRAPRDALAIATLRWPVTVFRVRLHLETSRRPDPFARFLLDAARIGERDPQRLATLLDVDPELIQAVWATLQGEGALDTKGRLTEVGERRRLDVEVDEARVGWVMRDDLTGAPLPYLAERDLRRTAPSPAEERIWPDDAPRAGRPDLGWQLGLASAVRQHVRLERGDVVAGPASDDDEPATMADAEERKAASADLELVGEGIWDELAVDVWFDRGPDGPELRAGCPFGRVEDGPRYLLRVERTRAAFPDLDAALRRLRREADERFLQALDDERDEAVRAAKDRLLADVRRRPLPNRVRIELEDAVIRRMRAERGHERVDKAIHQYGLVAEAILTSAVPRDWAPDPAWLTPWAASLPADLETAARLLAELISGLAPPDDDGHGFVVPDSARIGLPGLVSRLVRREASSCAPAWRGWPRSLHGAGLLAAPLVAAALPPKAPNRVAERTRAWVSAAPGAWRHLCIMVEHRNTKGAHLQDFPEARLREALTTVASSAEIVLDAFYPTEST